jgi:hypothetical protein
MIIKLNKYINHFKATSILCLCVNKIIPPLLHPSFLWLVLLYRLLLVSQYQWWCVIFYNYHYPQVLETHSCYSLDHSSEYHNGLSCPVYCITLVLVSVHPFADLCFMFCASYIEFVFPVVCATPSFFIYAEGTNCDICITNFHTAVCLFLMSSCIIILLLKQNIIFNCNIMFLMYCFQASQSIHGAQWWR